MNYVYELYYELYLFIFGNISAETFKKFNQTWPTDCGCSFNLSATYRLLARSYQRKHEHFSRPTPEVVQILASTIH